ncbi:MAG: SWF/SNF helicase family protein [Polyangiaceae bacterium]|nr:SWF/SNF helicase family protein [Polyangiaceae bacterium]
MPPARGRTRSAARFLTAGCIANARGAAIANTSRRCSSRSRKHLPGATDDRAAVVNAFRNTDIPVFLISLKAGGTGLNLVEADTVIHYDPWWNPAVEDQATDRAHRIGQTKPVFVHRLIAKDTVEEKIVALQKKKAVLARGLLEGSSKVDLDVDAVEALLAPIPRRGG